MKCDTVQSLSLHSRCPTKAHDRGGFAQQASHTEWLLGLLMAATAPWIRLAKHCQTAISGFVRFKTVSKTLESYLLKENIRTLILKFHSFYLMLENVHDMQEANITL